MERIKFASLEVRTPAQRRREQAAVKRRDALYFACTGGKQVPVGKRCPHCGARTTGEECRL